MSAYRLGALPFEAVIFDCDGVLIDSEAFHDAVTIEEVRSRGIELPPGFLDPHRGRRIVDQVEVISTHYGIEPGDLLRAREARFWRSAVDGVKPVRGSAACVRSVHKAGLSIAVASSGTGRWIQHVLRELDVGDCVSHVVSGDEVLHPKPHPESYLRASQLLGVPAVRCVVVEDSALGYKSALAAGCSVVMLMTGAETASGDLFPAAHAVAPCMDDVSRLIRDAAVEPFSKGDQPCQTM